MDTHSVVLPLKQYKGTCVFGGCQTEEIEHIEVRDDDVWVLSSPRSGTTLTQEIVYLIKTKLDFAAARSTPMDLRFPFLDMYNANVPQFQGVKGVMEMKPPRMIKSHLHYHALPPQVYTSNCKKIYIMRNPKDVFVSFYMLARYFEEISGDCTLDEYLDEWLNNKTYATPWWLHVSEFWLHRSDKNLLILRYEDMVKDLQFTVTQIAEHLEVKLTEDEVGRIVEHCKFENMQKNPSVNAEWQQQSRAVNKEYGGHIREGKVGGWKKYLSPEASAKIEKMVTEKLSDIDLHFET